VKSRCLFSGMMTGASTACAAESPEVTSGIGLGPGLLQATLGLAVVLALIRGAAWLLRRLGASGSPANSPIKIIAAQSLGQRERVVLIEFADNWLLLGVTPGQINALQTMPKSTLPDAAPAGAPFARLLALAKNKRQDPA